MKTNILCTGLMAFALLACTACGPNKSEQNEHGDAEHHEHMHDDSIGTEHEAHASYQCAMKCEGDETYANAGKCPVCEMDLAEVE